MNLPPTIPARLQAQGKMLATAPAYHYKEGGRWNTVSWGKYAEEVRLAGQALIELDVQAGHTTAILGFNRPEWCVFANATMSVGAAPAGIYTTNSPEEVAYIVNHAEAQIILVENKEQWEKVLARLDDLPSLKKVVVMRGAEAIDHELVLEWEAFMALAPGKNEDTFHARIDALKPDDLATFIYTSGTTGPPKGVMLSHENVAWTSEKIREVFPMGPSDRGLSYLPLSHIAEQMFTIHSPSTFGSQVYFAESLEKLADNLKEAKPTIFFGVPRIWEKFYAALQSKFGGATGVKKGLLEWARGVGAEVVHRRNHGQILGLGLTLQYRLATKLIFSKVKEALGLGETRYFFSGAAPVSKEILEFFSQLDITVFEVYGQSEDNGPTTINRTHGTRFGTVGLPYPGVEVKIAEDGEILVKGPNVFKGYFKDQAATDEVLIDDWLYSGDLGAFDDEGFLTITGRKKDIIITAGGKNIAPKNIEAALKDDPLIGEAVVIGDRRKFLSALIALDPDEVQGFATEKGLSVDNFQDNSTFQDRVQTTVNQVNSQFARVEHIRKFSLLPRPLTIDDGELTPTLKVKRKNVNENWSNEIEAMYVE